MVFLRHADVVLTRGSTALLTTRSILKRRLPDLFSKNGCDLLCWCVLALGLRPATLAFEYWDSWLPKAPWEM